MQIPRILEQGLHKDANGTTVAEATGLGWIITGSQPATANAALSSELKQFWLQDELISLPAPLTSEELECENHFISTFRRDKEERFILRLPFKSNINVLGNSKDLGQSIL